MHPFVLQSTPFVFQCTPRASAELGTPTLQFVLVQYGSYCTPHGASSVARPLCDFVYLLPLRYIVTRDSRGAHSLTCVLFLYRTAAPALAELGSPQPTVRTGSIRRIPLTGLARKASV